MLAGFLKFITKFFGGGERTAQLKKNVAYSILIKLGSIFCSFILVPLTINFVNPVQYGIWLTISSIVAWMSFFDVGFTNGLRNKLAATFAKSQVELSKIYVSTTYAILGAIFGILALILCALISVADLCSFLKIESFYETDLKTASYVLILYFCSTFVLKILSVVLIADQRPALSSYIELVGQILVLGSLLIVKQQMEGSLKILSLVLCVPPAVVWIGYSFYYFRGRYRHCAPSLSAIDFNYAAELLGLGVKFFIIQIAAIIQFQTANILIARIFSMEDVTEYNIAYKYFNVLNMAFMIVLQPFWSAVTNAYVQSDLHWIMRAVKKYLALAGLAICGGFVMLLFSSWVYQIWLGGTVHVSLTLSFWMLIYFITLMFGAIFVYFVNGIGALKIQYISSMVSPFFFFVLVTLFCRILGMGVYAILIASILANYNGLILAPLQYYKIIVKHKRGIWTA